MAKGIGFIAFGNNLQWITKCEVHRFQKLLKDQIVITIIINGDPDITEDLIMDVPYGEGVKFVDLFFGIKVNTVTLVVANAETSGDFTTRKPLTPKQSAMAEKCQPYYGEEVND